ncbi:MAG: 6-pyruvoyl-tetrahydropterin synthase-related protein, partial [Chloroflexota bacterium]
MTAQVRVAGRRPDLRRVPVIVPPARASRPAWLLGLFAALALTVPVWLPWLDPRLDLWQVDDAKNHMIRLYHLIWLIGRGVWHPRWMPDMFMGYGYPVLNFYAPASYYVAWLLGRLLHLDIWDAFRASGVVAALLGAAGVYTLTVALWRRAALGVLAAVTLLYGPYVFQLNLFKRGDIAEAMALGLIPWLLLALARLWLADAPGRVLAWMVATVSAGTAVILTHNLTALLAAPMATVWVGYLLVVRPAWRSLARVALAGALAIGLSAFFWLPAIGEGRLVQLEALWGTGGLDYRSWLVEPSGQSPRQQLPYNRQTRAGLIDLHLHYPHQLVAPPKVSLAQAGFALLTVLSLMAGIWWGAD